MKGEIGMEIKDIKIRKYGEESYEMTFHTIDGGFLHIVGDNDLKTLLTRALESV